MLPTHGVLMARFRRPESELAAEMRQAIGRLDRHLVVYGVGGVRQMLGCVSSDARRGDHTGGIRCWR